jgi:hypothetical protein
MLEVSTVWLLYTFIFAIMAYFVIWSRFTTKIRGWSVAILLLSGVATLPITYHSLGVPNPMKPPAGKYKVIGGKIEKDVAIWVMLEDTESGTIKLYVLPYSDQEAKDLQDAENGEGDVLYIVDGVGSGQGGGTKGAHHFENEEVVGGDQEKPPETGMFQDQQQ